jgi:hypothetical protein
MRRKGPWSDVIFVAKSFEFSSLMGAMRVHKQEGLFLSIFSSSKLCMLDKIS